VLQAGAGKEFPWEKARQAPGKGRKGKNCREAFLPQEYVGKEGWPKRLWPANGCESQG